MLCEVLCHRDASWLPGETTPARDARMRASGTAAASACYPGTYPGRVISVRAVRDVIQGRLPSLRNMADKDHPVIVIDLDAEGRAALASRTSKIVDGHLEPVTFDDRWGATAKTIDAAFGSREAAEAAEAKADDAFDFEGRRFVEASGLAGSLLPPTITHTGTGLYSAKAVPTKNDDTQLGGVAGQVVTLTVGGLGVADAFKGGYVTNVNRSQTRAIVSHTDDTVTLMGTISSWINGDDLDVYDAWSTIQGAYDQQHTDQGSALFTISQYIRIFAGTYVENVATSTAANPDEYEGHMLYIEGDPADSRDNIVVVPGAAASGFRLQANGSVVLRHLTIRPVVGNAFYGVLIQPSFVGSTISDCVIDGVQRGVYGNQAICHVEDSEISATISATYFNDARFAEIRRCIISGAPVQTPEWSTMTIDSCIFDGVGILDYSFSVTGPRVRNCTFYNAAIALDYLYNNTRKIDLINNIFEDCTTVINLQKGPWPGETETEEGQAFLLRNNCFHGYTTFANAVGPGETKTYAQFAALSGVDADGDLDDTDPLLTNPGAGDFSLQSGSPCKWTGHGSGVTTDYRGVAFDPNNPDIGSWSSGVKPADEAPDAPEITATDSGNQDEVVVDIVAGDPADVTTISYQIVPGGVIQEWGNTVTGDGSETLAGLLVQPYVIYAVAERGGYFSEPSNLEFVNVAAADQYTAMRSALYEWVKGVVGNPEVVWRESNAPQPARQYVSIKMDPTTPVGRDYHSGADTDGIETVTGNREYIFSIQVHGKPSNEDGSASISILERLRSSLEKRSIQDTLLAAGIAFVAEEGFGDLAGIGGTEWESRVFMDIRLRTTYQDADDVGYVGTVTDPAGTLE